MKAVTPAAVICAAFLVCECSDSEPTNPIMLGHPSLRTVVAQECSECHTVQRLNQVSFASWNEASALVHRMVVNGADLQGYDEDEVGHYIYDLLTGDDAEW